MKKHLQQSFTGGELSPSMYGRLDDQKYQQGLAVCRNFVVLPQGPVRNRAGFAFVSEVKDSGRKTRLYPFTFSTSDTMVLEIGHKYIRVISKGGYVPSAAGSTAPLEIVTPYDEADVMDLHFAQSADVVTIAHPSYPPKELRRRGPYSWDLSSIAMGAPLSAPNGLSGSYYCGDDQAKDAEKKAYNIKYKVTAIKTSDEGNLESEASAVCSVTGNLYLNASKITLTWNAVSGAERYRVYKTYSGIYGYVGEVDERTFVDNNIAPDTSMTPPRYEDPFKAGQGIVSVTVTNQGSGYVTQGGSIKTGTYTRYLTPVNTNGDNMVAAAASVMNISLVSSSGSGCVYTAKHEPLTGKVDITITNGGSGYKDAAFIVLPYPASTLDIPELAAIQKQQYQRAYSASGAANFRFEPPADDVGPTSAVITDSTGKGAELRPVIKGGKITEIQILSAGEGYTSPTITITPPWGGGTTATATASVGAASDYPGAVSYFEQRRIFAGSKNRPQFVWMTRPGTESDMHYCLPSQKDDRIKFRIAALQASRIRHIVPLSSLILMTTGAEFRVTTANDDMLTPNSVGVKPQSYVGASNVQPQIVNSSIVYAAERGGHVWELGYNWQASGFVTGDMCLRAGHLFDTYDVVDMALSKAPHPIIWCVSSSGNLLGCTYVPEQGIGAWHRHDTKGGVFESIACVAEGDEDILYAVVKRVINGRVVRYVERMHAREGMALEDSFFVDSGIEDRYTEARSYVDALDHLEGETVSILADGKVMPQAVVTNGRVYFPDKARHVIVGIPIEADIRTLPVALQDQKGGFTQGSNKNVLREYVRVYQSSGLKLGPDFENMTTIPPRKFEPYGVAPSLKDEIVDVMIKPAWGAEGNVCLRQDEPLPLMVCGLVAEIAT